MSCGDSYRKDLTNSIGSYSSYIARKVAIQNLNSITNCNYANNHNFNVKNNRLIYSNNYQSINKLKTYVLNLNCNDNYAKNKRPINIIYSSSM
jgi:type II secretory pathway component HofQ